MVPYKYLTIIVIITYVNRLDLLTYSLTYLLTYRIGVNF